MCNKRNPVDRKFTGGGTKCDPVELTENKLKILKEALSGYGWPLTQLGTPLPILPKSTGAFTQEFSISGS